jgi:tetratricopeptide (TPR) repeat protein
MSSIARDALASFAEELAGLRRVAGWPSLSQLAELTADLERPLTKSTIGAKLAGRSLPDWDFVRSFVRSCERYAENTGRALPPEQVDLGRWDLLHMAMLYAVDPDRAEQWLSNGTRIEPAANGRPSKPALVPRQLPPAVRHFVGRDAELAELTNLAEQASSTAVVAAIDGTPGVGKTTLALFWAHQMADRFPDGELYVNLRGFDPTGSLVTPADAVRGFLDALAVPVEQIPISLDSQVGLYRSLLAGKRMLVVLDNAKDAAQVRPLLPGTPGCLALVTSRNRLASLVAVEGARPLTLDLFGPADARRLLVRRLGRHRVAAEPEAVEDLIGYCAGLPLALAIVAARLESNPAFALATLNAELLGGRRLDGFAGEAETDLRTVFSWSYQQFGADAAALFRLLGIHPGPDVSPAAAASMAGWSADRVRSALAELARANVLMEHVPGRYTFHDLSRSYANEMATSQDTDADRLAAVHRMLDHYVHSSHAADRVLHAHRDPIELAPAGQGVLVTHPADPAQALAWFDTEHQVLLAALRLASAAGFDTHAYQLAWTLADFFSRRGHWRELAEGQRAALTAAERLGDRMAQALAHRILGSTYTRLGRYDDARAHLEQAVQIFGELDDRTGEASAQLHMSEMFERLGRHADALHHARNALDLGRAAGNQRWQARGLNAIGWYHGLLGEYDQALVHCRQALQLQQAIDDRHGAADSWDSLGFAHHHLGDHHQAIACYQQALRLWAETGERTGQADTYVNLGDAYAAAGMPESAMRAWQQALTVFSDLGHPQAEQVQSRLRAGGRPVPMTATDVGPVGR